MRIIYETVALLFALAGVYAAVWVISLIMEAKLAI